MTVLLTGGTGYIGSAVLRAFVDADVPVVAAVRSEAAAAAVEEAGARPAIGDVTDAQWLGDLLAATDGFVHAAAPSQGADDFDRAVVAAASKTLAGTEKAWVHTSGIWKYGNNLAITEESPLDAPALVSWRLETEAQVLDTPGVRQTIVTPGIVYGHGAGLANVVVSGPAGADGGITLIGDGTQHWTTVHVDDLAQLYLLAFERGVAGHEYLGISGDNPRVIEIAATASGVAGIDAEPVAESADETRARLGAPFADALLLDEAGEPTRAVRELGWEPRGATLLAEIEAGGYPRQA